MKTTLPNDTNSGRHTGVTRRTFVGLGALTLLGGLSGCLGRGFGLVDEVNEEFGWTFPPDRVDEVAVRNSVGDVLVVATDVENVEVEVRKTSRDGRRGLDAIDVDSDLAGAVLSVRATTDGVLRGDWGAYADVTVRVPRGEAGPVVTSAVTDAGDVTLLDTRGDAVVTTGAGDIVVSNVDGFLTLRSNAGSIEAAGTTGLDSVTTDAGEINVELRALRGDVEIGTDVGEVVVGVAADLDLDLDAEATDVSSDLPLTDTRSAGGRHTGRLNAGGYRLRVSSDLGRVSLRRI